ncbi:hypothetical protein OEZ86_005876 [Tetradesmus obliquus]|nr:hypothetical protein OEZ86_005876 [Tetradesmus obliquus]
MPVRLAAGSPADTETASTSVTKKVSLVSLGCPKNLVDGEVLLGDLARAGFSITAEHEEADAILVNTCAFVEDAKAESLEAIVEAAGLNADGKRRQVVVTGCLAQRYGPTLASDLPEADLVMGFQAYGGLPAALAQRLGMPVSSSSDAGSNEPSSSSRVQVGDATVPFRPEWDRHRLTPRHTAYLRVAEGCNHACTFCAIPGFRGKFRSKAWGAVLEEAERLVASGVVELNLIAEDTNQYGQDRRDGRGLAQLLRELSALPGLRWLRILYAYPSYFDDELVAEIAANPKVCKYIDMPLQHINNLTLLAMNRPPQAHTKALLAKLRDNIPGLALRTTFITGFPGESDEAHRELVDFAREFRFERAGAFAYSEEDGTPAAELPEQVPQRVRQRRRDELVQVQQGISEAFAASLVGQEIDVLVDGENEDGWLFGRTQWDAPDVDPIVFLSEPPASAAAGIAPLQAFSWVLIKGALNSMHTPGVLAFLHLLAAAVVQLVLAAWQVTEPPQMSSKAVKGSLVQATFSGVQVVLVSDPEFLYRVRALSDLEDGSSPSTISFMAACLPALPALVLGLACLEGRDLVEHEPSVPTLSVLLFSCLAFASATCLRVMLAYQLQHLPELRGVLTAAAAILAIVLDFMERAHELGWLCLIGVSLAVSGSMMVHVLRWKATKVPELHAL